MRQWRLPVLPDLHALVTAPLVFATLWGALLLYAITLHGRFPLIQLRLVAHLLPLVIVGLVLVTLTAPALTRLSRRATVIALALIVVGTAALVTGHSPEFGAPRARLYLFLMTTGLLVYALSAGRTRALLEPCLWMLGILHLFLFAMLVLRLDHGGPSGGDPSLLVPHFTNIRHFTFMSFFAAAAGSALQVLRPERRLLAAVLVASGLFAILLLGSRGALLAWVGSLGVLIALLGRSALPTLLWSGGALAVALVATQATLAMAGPELTALLGGTGGSMPQRVEVDTLTSDSERFGVWSATLQAIAQQPVLGYGPEGFLTTRCCAVNMGHPHNALLQYAFEFGLLGLALGLLALHHLLAAPLRAALAHRHAGTADPALAVCLSLLLASFGLSQVDGLLYFSVPLLVITLLSVLLAGLDGSST